MTIADLATFEILCDTFGAYRELHDAIYCKIDDPETGRRRKRTLAEYLEGKNFHTAMLYVQLRLTWQNFRMFMMEFGLSPSSRGKISIAPPDDSEEAREIAVMKKLLGE